MNYSTEIKNFKELEHVVDAKKDSVFFFDGQYKKYRFIVRYDFLRKNYALQWEKNIKGSNKEDFLKKVKVAMRELGFKEIEKRISLPSIPKLELVELF